MLHISLSLLCGLLEAETMEYLKKKVSVSTPGILCIWPIAKQLHSAFACQRTESTYL